MAVSNEGLERQGQEVPAQQISFTCKPLSPSTSAVESVTVMVNGRFGGKVDLRPGYSRYTVDLEPETLVVPSFPSGYTTSPSRVYW